jgi:hypothetical protein
VVLVATQEVLVLLLRHATSLLRNRNQYLHRHRSPVDPLVFQICHKAA